MPTQENIAWFAFGYAFAYALSWLLVTLRRRMAMRRLQEEFQEHVAATAECCEYTVQPGDDLAELMAASGITQADLDELNMGQWRWEPGEKVLLPRAACLYLVDRQSKGNSNGTEPDHR